MLDREFKKGNVKSFNLYGNIFKLISGIYTCNDIANLVPLNSNGNISVEAFTNVNLGVLVSE